jgi:YaiO family outer membrane protein
MKRRLLGILALALASAAPPAPAQDPAAAYSEAVAARRTGDPARAVELLRGVVAARPEDADAHLQLGLALMALGKEAEAEAALRRTLAIAPAYDDARIALARLAQRRGDREAAINELERVGPANIEAAGLREQLSAGAAGTQSSPEHRWSLNLDGSYSSLDRGQSDWREGSAELRYHADARTSFGASVQAARRFGATDVYGEVRVDRRVSGGASVYASLGGTPNADFRPEWQAGAGGSVRLRKGPAATVATLDARHANYRAGGISTLTPGVEQYLAGGKAWITGRWINIFEENGGHHGGWLARGDVMATRRLRLFAGVADAPDLDRGIVTETTSLFGGASYDLDARTTLRFSAARENRETGADRLQLGIGLGLRF